MHNVFGESFAIGAELWASSLHHAQSLGWRPAGTLPAPVRLEPASGPDLAMHAPMDYQRPAGQQVAREDALELAQALESALASTQKVRAAERAVFSRLVEFLRSGPFLICEFDTMELATALARSSVGSIEEQEEAGLGRSTRYSSGV